MAAPQDRAKTERRAAQRHGARESPGLRRLNLGQRELVTHRACGQPFSRISITSSWPFADRSSSRSSRALFWPPQTLYGHIVSMREIFVVLVARQEYPCSAIRWRDIMRLRRLLCAVTPTLVATVAALAATPGPLPPAADRQLAREIFKELVEINTTHAHGSTVAAVAIRDRLIAAGFPAGDVTLIAPADHPTKGNLVVRLRGAGHTQPILFIGHLDVVEARPEDWTVDPFKLTEKDGWFYGRGTIDMKDGDAAMLESLIRMRRADFRPARDQIVAFTADEEAGGDANGPAFLLKDHRDLVNASLVINLDGGGGAYRNGERAYLELGTSEKTYLTYTAETTSAGGHGSLPGPDNAIYRLADGLGRLEHFQFPVMLTATTRAGFEARAELPHGPASADMHAVARTPPDLAAAARLSQNVYFNAQLRTTC